MIRQINKLTDAAYSPRFYYLLHLFHTALFLPTILSATALTSPLGWNVKCDPIYNSRIRASTILQFKIYAHKIGWRYASINDFVLWFYKANPINKIEKWMLIFYASFWIVPNPLDLADVWNRYVWKASINRISFFPACMYGMSNICVLIKKFLFDQILLFPLQLERNSVFWQKKIAKVQWPSIYSISYRPYRESVTRDAASSSWREKLFSTSIWKLKIHTHTHTHCHIQKHRNMPTMCRVSPPQHKKKRTNNKKIPFWSMK